MKAVLKYAGLALLLSFAVYVSGQSSKTYLVSDFNEEELDQVLDLCHQGGFSYLLHRYPLPVRAIVPS